MDIFTKNRRSEIMKFVKSNKNKSTELELIKIFKEYSIKGWKRGYPVEGKPDFVFLDRKIAVFVDGCFWHGHDCRNVTPKDNSNYWDLKRIKNKERDEKVNLKFLKRNWIILRIWECELKKKNREKLLKKIEILLYPKINALEISISRDG